MDLKKFQSLLHESSLFFCRADKFIDQFECSIPKNEAEARWNSERRNAARCNVPYDEMIAKKNIEGLIDVHQRVKKATTVNCWHINENESDAMWQLYLKNNEGVAIQTTSDDLSKSLNNCEQNIGISKIRYLNYETDIWYDEETYPNPYYNFITPIVHKRIEFEHEKELRLYHHNTEAEKEGYWNSQPNHIGELIKLDLDIMINSVVFPPNIDQETSDIIIKIAASFGYQFNFRKSKLNSDLYY